MTPGKLQWGRRLVVRYTSPAGVPITLVDFDSQRATPALHCEVTITRHLRPEPQASRLIIYGLSKATRVAMAAATRAARELAYAQRLALRAGRLQISMGRTNLDLGLWADDAILDLQSEDTPPNSRLDVEAQDGRLFWDSFFLNTSQDRPPVAEDVALAAGVANPPLPDVRKRATVTYSVAGPGREEALAHFRRLGLIPVFFGDVIRYIPANGVLALPALALDTITVSAGLPGPWGYREFQVLADPGLMAGRQVIYQGAVGRIEEVSASLSTFANEWYSKLTVRPV